MSKFLFVGGASSLMFCFLFFQTDILRFTFLFTLFSAVQPVNPARISNPQGEMLHTFLLCKV